MLMSNWRQEFSLAAVVPEAVGRSANARDASRGGQLRPRGRRPARWARHERDVIGSSGPRSSDLEFSSLHEADL